MLLDVAGSVFCFVDIISDIWISAEYLLIARYIYATFNGVYSYGVKTYSAYAAHWLIAACVAVTVLCSIGIILTVVSCLLFLITRDHKKASRIFIGTTVAFVDGTMMLLVIYITVQTNELSTGGIICIHMFINQILQRHRWPILLCSVGVVSLITDCVAIYFKLHAAAEYGFEKKIGSNALECTCTCHEWVYKGSCAVCFIYALVILVLCFAYSGNVSGAVLPLVLFLILTVGFGVLFCACFCVLYMFRSDERPLTDIYNKL